MNEPSVFDNSLEKTFPFNLVHYGNVVHRDVHNIYGFLQVSTSVTTCVNAFLFEVFICAEIRRHSTRRFIINKNGSSQQQEKFVLFRGSRSSADNRYNSGENSGQHRIISRKQVESTKYIVFIFATTDFLFPLVFIILLLSIFTLRLNLSVMICAFSSTFS